MGFVELVLEVGRIGLVAHDKFLVHLNKLQLAALQRFVRFLHQIVALLLGLGTEFTGCQFLGEILLDLNKLLVLPKQLLIPDCLYLFLQRGYLLRQALYSLLLLSILLP